MLNWYSQNVSAASSGEKFRCVLFLTLRKTVSIMKSILKLVWLTGYRPGAQAFEWPTGSVSILPHKCWKWQVPLSLTWSLTLLISTSYSSYYPFVMEALSHFNAGAAMSRVPSKQHPATILHSGFSAAQVNSDCSKRYWKPELFFFPSDRKQLFWSFQSFHTISISRWSLHTWCGIVCLSQHGQQSLKCS